jgi:hypothetical protein
VTRLAVALLRAWDRADSVVFSLPLVAAGAAARWARLAAPLAATVAALVLLGR